MARRSRVHKVGMTVAVIGLLSVWAVPFVTFSKSRIATGVTLWFWQALPLWAAIVLGAPWIVLAAFSLSRRAWLLALARGTTACVALLVTFAATGLAATRLLAHASRFARVSAAGGPWIVAFLAYAMIMSARRELVGERWARWAVTLLAPLGLVALFASGLLSNLGVVKEYHNIAEEFWAAAGVQMAVSAAAIAIAVVVGVGLGLLAYTRRSTDRVIFGAVNVFQTIPGLAMIGLLLGPLAALANRFPVLRTFGIGGLGWAPLLIALTLYALLPIVRNTFEGLRNVPYDSIDAGVGMGMSSRQLLGRVELPIARPVIFSGIRTSAVQTVGNATLGAFVGGLGLGYFVVSGLAAQATDLIVLGSIGIVALALLTDAAMRVVELLVTPKGLRHKEGRAS